MKASTTRRPRGGGRTKRAPVRPTQKDIAAAAGVSQAAVSLVLNKAETPSVPAATRERILKLAGELGYQPSHPARMFRSARTMALACVIPDITNPFYPGLVRGLQSVAAPAGYDVLIFDTDGTPEGEARAVNWLLQGRADGVVATFFHLRIPELTMLARTGIPLVRLESQHKAEGPLPIDSVYIDNMEAAASMTRFLIARGHRGLDLDRAFGGTDDAGKLGEDAITGGVDDTTSVPGDQRQDHALMRLEVAHGGGLVFVHKPAVAGDVGGEDGGESAVHRGPRAHEQIIVCPGARRTVGCAAHRFANASFAPVVGPSGVGGQVRDRLDQL